ncbi:hypothetical protein [Evansella tamaricis]|uniref:Uncharacterized protein n=1 Tax=Evansella tamaricis TaxID=2069301 RepID=A0ABS6JBK4_9BACI|nr:hypothetical protein [Evansella tamaricis]MBU9711051.1 hypothetical protein [Evansella tamaricis]
MDDRTKNIGSKFIERFKKINDPIARIVTVHLFTESWLNKLLEEKTKTSGQLKEWNYASKLLMVFNLNLIEEALYKNLKILNGIRNGCSHNLDFNFENINLDDFSLKPIKNKIPKEVRKNLNSNTLDEKFLIISYITFGWLHNHCTLELKMNLNL